MPLVAGLATAPAAAQSAPPAPPSAPSAVTSPGPAATIDPAQTARARAEFDAWRKGTIDRSHYDATLNAKISDGNVTEMASALRTLGTIVGFSQLQRGASESGSSYFIYKVYRVRPERQDRRHRLPADSAGAGAAAHARAADAGGVSAARPQIVLGV